MQEWCLYFWSQVSRKIAAWMLDTTPGLLASHLVLPFQGGIAEAQPTPGADNALTVHPREGRLVPQNALATGRVNAEAGGKPL